MRFVEARRLKQRLRTCIFAPEKLVFRRGALWVARQRVPPLFDGTPHAGTSLDAMAGGPKGMNLIFMQ